MMVQDKRLMSIADAIAEFGVTDRQVRYWLKHGKLRRYFQPLTRRVMLDANELAPKLAEIIEEGDDDGQTGPQEP